MNAQGPIRCLSDSSNQDSSRLVHAGRPHIDPRLPPLGDYFGFDGLEIISIGNEPGPMLVADLNNDGLKDLVVATSETTG